MKYAGTFQNLYRPDLKLTTVFGLLSGVMYSDSLLAFLLGNVSREINFYSINSVVDIRLEYCLVKWISRVLVTSGS